MRLLSKGCIFIAGILFALLMAAVYTATLFLDRNIDNIFENYAHWSSGGYYAAAILILLLVIKAADGSRGKFALDKRVLTLLMTFMAVLVAVYQYKLSRWMPVNMANDFLVIREMAINLAEGGSFQDYLDYFQVYPNNVGIAVLLSWIYRVVGSWRNVIFTGLLATDIAAIVTGLTVYNSTKNTCVTLLASLLGEILIAMNWRAAIPYTDNFALLFVSIIIWVYTSGLGREYKAPLIVVSGMIGTWIKVTVLIVLLALLIDCVLRMMAAKSMFPDGKKEWIRILCSLLVC